jgi:GTP:adenosylcobinamide-phosphate guanylyltransferase
VIPPLDDPAPPHFTAIVLAGQRAGGDPVAAAQGARRKALLPVAGRPMLAHVLGALAASRWIRTMVVAIDDPAVIGPLSEADALCSAGRLVFVESAPTPSLSVLAVLEEVPGALPALITTADHPLLTPEILDWFCAAAARSDADLIAALTPKAALLKAYPDAHRTFLNFAGEHYTGSNLFAIRTPAGLSAVRFWRQVEVMRKRPWRLILAFGAAPLVRYLLGRLSLLTAMRIASRRIGARVDVVICPFPEAGIDVDKTVDLELVERILKSRS